MAQHAPIQIRYARETRNDSFQVNHPGAQTLPNRRGWFPQVPSNNGSCLALLRLGGFLYVGGAYFLVNNQNRSTLAAYDIATGELGSWNPGTNGYVTALATDGQWIYIGGTFTLAGGLARGNLARVGLDGTVDPSFVFDATGGGVLALACDAEAGILYVGGDFTAINGTGRARIAAIDLSTPSLGAFDPAADASVRALAVRDSQLYVGGSFTTIAAATRNRLARFAAGGGLDTGWDPGANAPVRALLPTDGGLYVGGEFNGSGAIGGQNRSYVALLAEDGTVDAWAPQPDALVAALALGAKGDLVIGGSFLNVNGSSRTRIAALDAEGVLNPDFSPVLDGACVALQALERTVYAGGTFVNVDGVSQRAVTALGLPAFSSANAVYVASTGSDQVDIAADTWALWGFDGDYGWDRSGLENHLLARPGLNLLKAPAPAAPGRYSAGAFASSVYFELDAPAKALFSGAAAYTVEFYVKVDSTPSNDSIFAALDTGASEETRIQAVSSGSGFRIRWSGFGGASALTTSNDLALGTWYHVACVNDPGSVLRKIYIDNVQDGATSGTLLPMPAAIASGVVGGYPSGNPLQGQLDEMRVSGVVRTSFPTTDSDQNDGSPSQPYASIPFAVLRALDPKLNVVVLDGAAYDGHAELWRDGVRLWAADGFRPQLLLRRGALAGSYGARDRGRAHFYAGAGTVYHVAKSGQDSNSGLSAADPLASLGAAVTAASDGDCVQIDDSGVYMENLSLGTKGLCFQAADGQVPTLVNEDPSLPHFATTPASGTPLSLFGLNVVDRGDSEEPIVLVDGPVEAWDCSFANAPYALQLDGEGVVHRAENCNFVNQGVSAIAAAGSLRAANSRFGGNGKSGVPALDLGIASRWNRIAGCSFVGCNGSYALRFKRQGTLAGLDRVERCLFEDGYGGVQLDDQGTSTAVALAVTDCLFQRLRAAAVRTEAYGGAVGTLDVLGCVAQDCNQAPLDQASFQLAAWKGSLLNCLAAGSGLDGYYIGNLSGNSAALAYCSAVNSGRNGWQYVGGGTLSAEALAESGSASTAKGFQSSVPLTLRYSCVASGVNASVTLGDGAVVADPLFLDTTGADLNVGLDPRSPAVLAGNADGTRNAGKGDGRPSQLGFEEPLDALLVLSASGGGADGFWLEDRRNGLQGAYVLEGLGAGVELSQCSLEGLGAAGLRLASASRAQDCLLRTWATGASLLEPSSALRRCLGLDCGGAFIFNGGVVSAVDHSSSSGALFGQYDTPAAFSGLINSNVLFGNVVADYSGGNIVRDSTVGVLDGSGLREGGGAADPLFRRPLSEDLRLQVTEAGYLFNSPAKEAGQGGSDQGAYAFDYAAGVESWSSVTLDYNPDGLQRRQIPVKAFEGETEAGNTYSDAREYRTEYHFTWRQENPMPDAQLAELNAIYSLGGGLCQISFDGGATWTGVRVVRSSSFEWDDLDSRYNDADKPTPLREIVFRESD